MQDNARLQAARAEAQASRDIRKDGQALVNIWREVCKPRKAGAVKLQPPGSKVDTETLFQRWLEERGLADALELSSQVRGWHIYRYKREPVIHSQPDWEAAFHGTWWYAVWMVLHTGIFLESSDRSLGHDFWEPGVYCSPNLDTGIWYARPHILFGDGVYHRIIFEVRVDPKRRKRNRKAGGVQWVFPCDAISLHAVWIRSNTPPANGEERINNWDPELEAIPVGRSRPPVIVNPRKEPWPYVQDPWPWDHEGESDVPPWMRSTVGKPKKEANNKGPQSCPQSFGKHHLGGLYGHWLKKASLGALPSQQQLAIQSHCAIPVAQNHPRGATASNNHAINGGSLPMQLNGHLNGGQPRDKPRNPLPEPADLPPSIFSILLRSVRDDHNPGSAAEPPAINTMSGLLKVCDDTPSQPLGTQLPTTHAQGAQPPKPRAAARSLAEPAPIPFPVWKQGVAAEENWEAVARQYGFAGGFMGGHPPTKKQKL